jgi:uncharacterized membrane protein
MADDTAPVPGRARLEAFSDGVIAIAATLLVIELAVPSGGEDVWHAIRHELPAMAAFAVSFLTILIFWINHHALVAGVRRVDRGILLLKRPGAARDQLQAPRHDGRVE